MGEILLSNGSFYLEEAPDGQWITKYSDGSWAISTETEIVMWKIIIAYEKIVIGEIKS